MNKGLPMKILLLPLLLASVSPLSAQSPAQADTLRTRATRIQVSEAGVREHARFGGTANRIGGTQELTSAGSLWTHTDGGAAWVAEAVAIGDEGGQVLVEYGLNNEAVALLSSYDANPPAVVWTDNTPLDSEFQRVDSARSTANHVTLDQVVLGGNFQTRQAVVRKYTSSSASPDWTYTFAPVIDSTAKVAISRDGSIIVAAIMNNNTASMEIAVFDALSGTPTSYTVLPPGSSTNFRGWDLSADGSTLYFTQSNTVHLFDVGTASVIFTTNIGSGFDSHAISGDGSVFAFGRFNSISIWERSGGTYANTITKTLGGQVYCAQVDISDDGSTVAYGWYYYAPGLTIQINALDVASGAVTMTDIVVGAGTFQNLVADISCSADGSRFAVGLWGDEAGLADEVRVYSKTLDAPVQTANLPGSVFDIDISADGQRVVAGSKAVHANTFGHGGQVDLVDTGGEDLILRGAPKIGRIPALEIHGPPGNPSFLLSAGQPQDPPILFPALGTLHVHRATILITHIGSMPASGTLAVPFGIANDPALIGTTGYYQVLFLSPRRLTQDWIKLTFLP